MNQTTLAASWSELGRINIWDLNEQLRAVDDRSIAELELHINEGN